MWLNDNLNAAFHSYRHGNSGLDDVFYSLGQLAEDVAELKGCGADLNNDLVNQFNKTYELQDPTCKLIAEDSRKNANDDSDEDYEDGAPMDNFAVWKKRKKKKGSGKTVEEEEEEEEEAARIAAEKEEEEAERIAAEKEKEEAERIAAEKEEADCIAAEAKAARIAAALKVASKLKEAVKKRDEYLAKPEDDRDPDADEQSTIWGTNAPSQMQVTENILNDAGVNIMPAIGEFITDVHLLYDENIAGGMMLALATAAKYDDVVIDLDNLGKTMESLDNAIHSAVERSAEYDMIIRALKSAIRKGEIAVRFGASASTTGKRVLGCGEGMGLKHHLAVLLNLLVSLTAVNKGGIMEYPEVKDIKELIGSDADEPIQFLVDLKDYMKTEKNERHNEVQSKALKMIEKILSDVKLWQEVDGENNPIDYNHNVFIYLVVGFVLEDEIQIVTGHAAEGGQTTNGIVGFVIAVRPKSQQLGPRRTDHLQIIVIGIAFFVGLPARVRIVLGLLSLFFLPIRHSLPRIVPVGVVAGLSLIPAPPAAPATGGGQTKTMLHGPDDMFWRIRNFHPLLIEFIDSPVELLPALSIECFLHGPRS